MNLENKNECERKLASRNYNEDANICSNCIHCHPEFFQDDGMSYYCTYEGKPYPYEIPPINELSGNAKLFEEDYQEELKQLELVIKASIDKEKIQNAVLTKKRIIEKHDERLLMDLVWDWRSESIEVTSYGTCDKFESKKG